jgi:threonylcarbamoyladenosine tRNA methylthiotransferase MtaB
MESEKPTVAAATLGCKVNFCDTEEILSCFVECGWRRVGFKESADVYVINTCAVTAASEGKSRRMIRRAKSANPGALVIVTGCYAKTSEIDIDGIWVLSRENILTEVAGFSGYSLNKRREKIDDKINRRMYLKVQDGCDNFCAYCIVPYARGQAKSRLIADVTAEAADLARRGCREIVVSGICLPSFGKDTGEGLIDLIAAVYNTEGIERIRISSIDPTAINQGFLAKLAALGGFCPHFHLSLQSGCDKTLSAMRRRYSTAEYAEAVGLIRGTFGDVSVTTDIIAGFPGETYLTRTFSRILSGRARTRRDTAGKCPSI